MSTENSLRCGVALILSWGVQGQDIRELTPGQHPWTSGAQLTVLPLAPHATVLPFPDEKALFTLRVVHGPDSHSQFPLSRGSWEIGRQASLLTIDDPALAPVEGFLEVTASGVYFSNEGSHRKLEVGEKFILGGSVLVLDQYEYRAPFFRDPVGSRH